MKYDKFFELAKAAGIEEAELSVSTSYSLSFSLFHGEIDSYTSSNSSSYLLRGIYKGKLGAISSDIYNNGLAQFFVDQIINNASVIENDDPVFIFSCVEFCNDIIGRIFAIYEKKLSRREYRHVNIVCDVCPAKRNKQLNQKYSQ